MSKRKNWVAYCVLTVLAVILYIVFAKESIRLEHYLAAGRGASVLRFLCGHSRIPASVEHAHGDPFRLLWKSGHDEVRAHSEIAVFLLVILLIIGMFTIGLRQYFYYLKDFYEGRTLLYPSILAGFALGDVILGIRKLRNNDTEQGETL